jgi:hypothetical protein
MVSVSAPAFKSCQRRRANSPGIVPVKRLTSAALAYGSAKRLLGLRDSVAWTKRSAIRERSAGSITDLGFR